MSRRAPLAVRPARTPAPTSAPTSSLLLRALALVAATLLAAAPSATAQDKLCGTCNTTGMIDIELDSKAAMAHEHGDGWMVEYSSVAIERDDLGLDWAPCPRCKAKTLQAQAQERWDAVKADKEAWLAERRRMDGLIDKDDIVHIQTTHYLIAWDVAKLKIGKKTMRAHDAAHEFARRLERFYNHFQTLCDVTDEDMMRTRHQIFVFDKLRDAMEVGPVYANMSSTTTARRAGGVDHESTLIVYRDKNGKPSAEDLERHFIHSLVHQFTAVHYNPMWFTEGQRGLSPPWLADKYGWLDAGLAHWFEIDFDGEATTYCMQEQDTSSRWKGGDWRKNVHKAVVGGRAPSFASLKDIPTQALTPQQHQFVWSWVDYLMAKDTKAMGQAVKLAKMEAPARDILKQAFGVSMLSFESDWAEWVLAEYDPKKKKS